MYDPSVVLFVKEYRSRIVSVIGAVAKPGFYSLSSETETILDAVAQAGGLTEHAAQRLYLIPASAAAGPSRSATAPGMPGSGAEEPVFHEIRRQSGDVSPGSLMPNRVGSGRGLRCGPARCDVGWPPGR